jgi:hypothetical protein
VSRVGTSDNTYWLSDLSVDTVRLSEEGGSKDGINGGVELGTRDTAGDQSLVDLEDLVGLGIGQTIAVVCPFSLRLIARCGGCKTGQNGGDGSEAETHYEVRY